MTTIVPIRTGTIRIRPSHRAGEMGLPVWRRRLTMLTDRDWTEPLPIYTYLVDHSEGLILLDCGETSRAGFFPWWHPFFRFACDIAIEPGEEIGPQLRAMGIDPGRDLRALVLSHLHHDHADGMEHFEGARIVVSRQNYAASRGLRGALLGAVPSRWPAWFEPEQIDMREPGVPGFDGSVALTDDGTVFAVPTPGHMPGHLSLVVRTPKVTYFLTGDATYDEDLLRRRIVDGPASDIGESLRTMDAISTFARSEPTVLLPAHDPLAHRRLDERRVLIDA